MCGVLEVRQTLSFLLSILGEESRNPGCTIILDMRHGWVKYLKTVLKATQVGGVTALLLPPFPLK